jgi:hypothetical protein
LTRLALAEFSVLHCWSFSRSALASPLARRYNSRLMPPRKIVSTERYFDACRFVCTHSIAFLVPLPREMDETIIFFLFSRMESKFNCSSSQRCHVMGV